MPRMPKKPCRYPGCPLLVDERYCPEHQSVMDARYNRFHRDPQTKKRYGYHWSKIRARHLAEHPLCVMCRKNGQVTPANEVHHIVPLADGGTHAPDNLMSLCKSCHSRITVAEGWRHRHP